MVAFGVGVVLCIIHPLGVQGGIGHAGEFAGSGLGVIDPWV